MTPALLGPVAWMALVVAAPPTPKLETVPVQEVEAVLTQEYNFPKFQATDWLVVAPKLLELPSQTKVNTSVEVAGSKQEPTTQRGLIVFRLPGKDYKDGFRVECKYRATLNARLLTPLKDGDKAPEVVPLTGPERREWLKANKDLDHVAKDFQQWLTKEGLRRQSQEGDLDCARRLFLFVSTHFKYQYEAQMDRVPAAVCKAGQSDCGGLSGLYVAALRANGIPARTLAGRWALSAKKDDKIGSVAYYQVHVKAEFFAEGIGWVPVDPAGGVQQGEKAKDLTYFGQDKGDFLVLGLSVDHTLNPKGFGMVNFRGDLQGPTYWGLGKGSLDPVKVTEDWKVVAKSLLREEK